MIKVPPFRITHIMWTQKTPASYESINIQIIVKRACHSDIISNMLVSVDLDVLTTILIHV